MDKVARIRQEIERLYDGEAPKHDQQCDFSDGYFTGLSVISNFLDTLSEEPDKSLEEAAEEYADKHGFRVPYDGSNNYYDNVDVKASKEGFLAGAEWMVKQGVTFTAAVDHYEDFYLDSCDQEAEAIKKLGLKVMDWAIVQIRKK